MTYAHDMDLSSVAVSPQLLLFLLLLRVLNLCHDDPYIARGGVSAGVESKVLVLGVSSERTSHFIVVATKVEVVILVKENVIHDCFQQRSGSESVSIKYVLSAVDNFFELVASPILFLQMQLIVLSLIFIALTIGSASI